MGSQIKFNKKKRESGRKNLQKERDKMPFLFYWLKKRKRCGLIP
ncbi:hypothetical protein HMPREF9130_1571 [Peptoniphilus sp. oral taxon 375 str. F0436]|nr:hypothetical protein HMPREF9130_1571 [Peptoniphilus sp. oral taxon 375 str. F0436]